jgi:hypothetical protein
VGLHFTPPIRVHSGLLSVRNLPYFFTIEPNETGWGR